MKRSLQIRVALVVVVLLASIYGLIPTFRAATIPAEDRALAESDSAVTDPTLLALREKIAEIDAKAIRRGLDLLGGMYLVYEVNQEGMTPEQARDALNRVQEIIRNRIDQFGVSEPVIQTQGHNRIIVQLPGIRDPERARNLIGRTAQLEFRLVRTNEDYETVIKRLDDVFKDVADTAPATADSAITGASAPADSTAAAEPDSSLAAAAAADSAESASPFDDLPPLPTPTTDDLSLEDPFVKEHPFSAYCYLDPQMGQRYGTPLFVEVENLPIVQHMLRQDDEGRYLQPGARAALRNMEFQFGSETVRLSSGLSLRPLFLLNATASLAGDRLSSARTSPDNDRPGSWQVQMNLDRKGARQFSKITGENIGRYLAISLDGVVDCAPVIRTKIPSGQASITGGYTNQEASDLALLLRAGALPTEIKLEMERTVGPSLGRDSIRRGVNAALVGSLLVVLFIILYYRLTGLIVVAALVSNIIILLAVLAQFGLVLTLPGIAGIILTIGMAVDANVLINERIREELHKKKTVRAAVDSGYGAATRTIIDANVTTLIAGVILLWFGTGPIKGFAVTLCIGILSSMFTALVLTRLIMEYMTRGKAQARLSI